jgi:exopolysaccharide production protein ExoQ
VFQIQDDLLVLIGRDPTLTHRTELWTIVGALQTNAFIGTGFMSFWSGDRLAAIWKSLGPGLNQAHNGYLEQYLNLGYVGVAFIVLIAIAALRSIWRQLLIDYPSGVLRLSFLVMALLYNYTEASFYGINNMWVLFLIAAFEPSTLQTQVAEAVPQFAGARLPRAQTNLRGLKPVAVERRRATPAFPRQSLLRVGAFDKLPLLAKRPHCEKL